LDETGLAAVWNRSVIGERTGTLVDADPRVGIVCPAS